MSVGSVAGGGVAAGGAHRPDRGCGERGAAGGGAGTGAGGGCGGAGRRPGVGVAGRPGGTGVGGGGGGRGGGRERARAVDAGALAVDLESAWLAAAAGGRPVAVVRAISDTPQRPLRSPAALAGGLRALRSLRAAGPALTRWAAAVGHRRVLLAGPRSFCAGVERAIEIVEKLLEQQGPPVYVRKQIVHNT